jgi:hypothetical protein
VPGLSDTTPREFKVNLDCELIVNATVKRVALDRSSTVTAMIERRQELRRRCFLGGKLAFNSRESLFDCLIHNVTEGGALIVLPRAMVLPQEFELHIARWQRTFRAGLIWSMDVRSGVKLAAFVPEIVSLEEVRRLKALKAENRRLRGLIGNKV